MSNFVGKIFTKEIISFFKFVENFTKIFQFFYLLIHFLVKRNLEIWFLRVWLEHAWINFEPVYYSKTPAAAVDINLHLQE